MFGKVVQLIGIPLEDEFKTIYGIDDIDSEIDARYGTRNDLGFGRVSFANPDATKTYISGGHLVEDEGDGFKEVIIFNGELSKEDQEEYLLVIIPRVIGYLKTEAKRVAGRYIHQEGILEMHDGDTVEVSKGDEECTQIYMAVKAGNEMFLIKKSR